jgi:hypothetical protein
VQEPALADPAALLDEFAMHDRDLAGRSTETHAAEFEPEGERRAEWHVRRRPGRQAFPAAAHGAIAQRRAPFCMIDVVRNAMVAS